MNKAQIIERHKVISFDLFDTLINREISRPKNIFKVCEQEFIKQYGYSGISNYAICREQCEQTVRSLHSVDITLDQIFQEMEKYSDHETISKYKEIEINAEINFSVINCKGREWYEQSIASKKKIIITTDMYLSSDIIKIILERNGYSQYNKLYLSSEIGLTKAKGNIYKYILEQEKVCPRELLHIGDNLKSDILNAKKIGIHTIFLRKITPIKRKQQLKPIGNLLALNILSSFLHNRESTISDNVFAKTGYTCLGPLLYGFLDWLDTRCVENNIEYILFFSRDGYLMQKIYAKMDRKSSAKFSYFFASRRALQVAAICLSPTYNAVINMMHLPRCITVGWLLNNWGLDISLYQEQLKSLDLSAESKINREELLENEQIIRLFEILKQDIVSNSQKECQAFQKYLEVLGCRGRIAIVDIGWYGNMQRAFERIVHHFNLDITVHGYYLGIVPESINQLEWKMQGYLFQKEKNEWLFFRETYINCMLELFLVAPHGSLRKYFIADNGSVNIKQEDFEYKNTTIYHNIKELQNGAEQFASEFKKIAHYVENDELVYSYNMMSRFLNPSFQTVKTWQGFKMWDGGWVNIIKCKSLSQRWKYLFEPYQFVNDFLESSWKIGFLKEVLRLPLPYADILMWLRKHLSTK